MKGENTVMNGAEKKKATPADKAVNAIIVLIILSVKMELITGFEPATHVLRIHCSTN
jgi:hypothetical protein